MTRADVCLVLMPYGPVLRPSLALGLLKARLVEHGIAARVQYSNLVFAEEVGLEAYRFLHEQTVTEDLIGEWTFSAAAFPGFHPDHTDYFRRLKLVYPRELVWSLRRAAPGFVRREAERIVASQPRVVGCSSTFQQHCASLALLREIKALDPRVVTLLGGANCEGAMGWMTAARFPWVDYVVSGEADNLVAGLCRDLLDGRIPLDQPLPLGVFSAARVASCRAEDLPRSGAGAGRATLDRLDDSPVPDFSDYFEALGASALRRFVRPGGLPIETSRGCWWGEKHHCTFCGLNGAGMNYRSKSPARVRSEIDLLTARHGLDGLEVVDNILDMAYFKSVLPGLKARRPPLRVFFETKSNLKRGQVRELAEAGVRWIQPGIESLNDDALRLLDKGNSTLANLELLKWSLHEGVHVTWQMLAGIPGERDEWYLELARWLPLVYHLQAPGSGLDGIVPIRFDRFSPYHQRPESFGLRLRAYRTYAAVYPLEDAELDHLAYFFEDEAFDAGPNGARQASPRPGLRALRKAILEWQRLWYGGKEPPRLTMADGPEGLEIVDTRPLASAPLLQLRGLSREIYLACVEATNPERLPDRLAACRNGEANAPEVNAAVAELSGRGLLLALNGRLLSLAVEPAKRALAGPLEFPGGHYRLRKAGPRPRAEPKTLVELLA